MSVTLGIGGGGPVYLASWSGDTKAAVVASDKVLIWDSVADDFKETTIGALMGGLDVLMYKGAIDCSGNPNYPAADAGHEYRISVAGLIGGAAGQIVQAGDIIICNTDGTVAGTQAAVGGSWNIIQLNIQRPVEAPASSTDNAIPRWNGAGATTIQDSDVTIDDGNNLSIPGNITTLGNVIVDEYVQTNEVKAVSTTGGGSLSLKSSGNQGIEIDSTGQTGIGVTPERILHTRSDMVRFDRDKDTAGILIPRYAADYAAIWKTFAFGVNAIGLNDGYWFISDFANTISGANTKRFVVANTGNVGVGLGNTMPDRKLHMRDDMAMFDNDETAAGIIISRHEAAYADVWKTFSFRVDASGIDTGGSLSINDMADGVSGAGTSRMFFDNIGKVGVNNVAPTGRIHVTQPDAGAVPVSVLEQLDVSEEFINFISTIGTGNAIEAVAAKTFTPTHVLKMQINGALKYIQIGDFA